MARIRTIKPQFWRSPDIMQLDYFQRLLYIGLWNLADDEGRGVYSPASIAADLFLTEFSLSPQGTITDVSNAFTKYRQLDMVVIYEWEGREYYQIVKWSDHQRINRKTASKIGPPTSENIITEGIGEESVSAHAQLTEESPQGQGTLTGGIRNKEGKEISESPSPEPAAPEASPSQTPSFDSLDDLADGYAAEQGDSIPYGTPEDPRCYAHRNDLKSDVPPCFKCKQARDMWAERDSDAKQSRRQAIDDCTLCDDSGWLPDTNPAQRCNHTGLPHTGTGPF